MVWGKKEKDQERKTNHYFFFPEYIPSEKEMGKIHGTVEEGRGGCVCVWDGEERKEWQSRGEVLAAARGPVMSDLHPWVLWLGLANCEGLHLHCRRKGRCWFWNKQDNMVPWLQINTHSHVRNRVRHDSYGFIYEPQWNRFHQYSCELWVTLIWTAWTRSTIMAHISSHASVWLASACTTIHPQSSFPLTHEQCAAFAFPLELACPFRCIKIMTTLTDL